MKQCLLSDSLAERETWKQRRNKNVLIHRPSYSLHDDLSPLPIFPFLRYLHALSRRFSLTAVFEMVALNRRVPKGHAFSVMQPFHSSILVYKRQGVQYAYRPANASIIFLERRESQTSSPFLSHSYRARYVHVIPSISPFRVL